MPSRDDVMPDPAGREIPAVPTLPFAVVIPTRNAGGLVAPMVEALRAQTARPLEILVVDSASEDGTAEGFRAAGARVHAIRVSEFDHGGTRNLAVSLVDSRAAAVVFLTQDAIPANPDAFARLLRPFADPDVAMAYGRQLPRPGAGALERHSRVFNYGPVSLVKRLPQARALGVKAAFSSDSFAAYRRAVLRSLGGFPEPVIVGEEQVVAARAMLAGWSVVYAADAEVIHSHGYTPLQEFRRYFDVGVSHATFPVIGREFGTAGSEGFAFIRSEVRYLGRHAPHLVPVAALHWAAKLIGYRLGCHAMRLPPSWRSRLTAQKSYFRADRGPAMVRADLEAAD